MSRYVPPHRKSETAADELGDAESIAFQKEAWTALSRSITGIVNRVSGDNLETSVIEMFRENIVRGRGLLARSLIRTQHVDPDLTCVLAALVSRINKDLPLVVLLLCKRLLMQWNRAYLRKDWPFLTSVSTFISWLYNFRVLDVSVIYQIILTHLMSEALHDEDVDQAARVFRETFKMMSQRARGQFHAQVLTPFRDLLAMDDDAASLSVRAQAVLEGCLKDVQQWERVKDEECVIAEHLILFDLEEQTTHVLDLEEKYNTEDYLDRFAYDKEYEEHEAQYELIRRTILGEDWEMQLLQQAAAAEEEAEAEAETEGLAPATETGNEASATAAALDAGKTLVDEKERQIRKEVYLAMRSSVRADEAVNKILRQMQPQTERSICFMVIEGCCEERSYKRVYGMTAERLCKSNARFQAFFAEAFHLRYLGAAELSMKQIEYSCRVFAHLLRTESMFWGRCLDVMDIIDNDESQRLFIQHLFQALAEALGMTALVERITKDRELISKTTKLFPLGGDASVLEHAINLYVAMGLGELAAPMRRALDVRKGSATQKRPRESADEEYI